ncbi:MAG: iron-containing redox enzyme family protein [Pirellulales bacterium]
MTSATPIYILDHPNRITSSADFGFDPDTLSAAKVLEFLDSRIQNVLHEFKSSELWGVISHPETSPALIQEIMKEIYLEIVMYQPDVIEATIAVIAQMPRTMDVDVFEEMLHHQIEEFNHGEMALRDYIGLGGNEDTARNRRMSPTAFSTAAVWRMLAHMRDPFAYLGALYPFEGLTPIVSEMVKGILREKGFQDNSTEFVDYHSTADLEHTRLVKELIVKVAEEYPKAKASMCYGIEYFLAAYPLPCWNAAFRRAKLAQGVA